MVHLLSRKRGSRLVVRTPEERTAARHPDLDDLISQTRSPRPPARPLSPQAQCAVREWLMEEPPDHVLALSFDDGMRRLLRFEIRRGLRCQIEVRSPQELADNPERTLARFSARGFADNHASASETSSTLAQPSIVVVVSLGEHFLMVSRGLLDPAVESRHTLIDCLLTADSGSQIPTADVLFCDAIVFDQFSASRRRKNAVAYYLIRRNAVIRSRRRCRSLNSLQELASILRSARSNAPAQIELR